MGKRRNTFKDAQVSKLRPTTWPLLVIHKGKAYNANKCWAAADEAEAHASVQTQPTDKNEWMVTRSCTGTAGACRRRTRRGTGISQKDCHEEGKENVKVSEVLSV